MVVFAALFTLYLLIGVALAVICIRVNRNEFKGLLDNKVIVVLAILLFSVCWLPCLVLSVADAVGKRTLKL